MIQYNKFRFLLQLLILLVLLNGDLTVQGITRNTKTVCSLEKQNITVEQLQAWYQNATGENNYNTVPKPDPNNELQQSALCGQTRVDQSQAIIIGEEAPENAWPWYVYLMANTTDRATMCGGSIRTEW